MPYACFMLGPSSRHAEDLWPLLCSMTSLDSCIDKNCSVDSIRMEDLVVLDCRRSFGHWLFVSKLHPELAAAHSQVIDTMQRMGAKIVPFDNFPELFELLNAFRLSTYIVFYLYMY